MELNGNNNGRSASDWVTAWSTYAKALALYPTTHTRIADALQSFLALATQVAAGRDEASIAFGNDTIWVDDLEIVTAKCTNGQWLKTRLDRVALAGARFVVPIVATSMLEFTQRLLSISSREHPGARFADLWPQTYAGIELIERCYDGGATGTGDAAGQQTRGPARRGQAQAAWLATVTSVAQRLETLTAKRGEDGNAQKIASDLLARIVGLMPVETVIDQQRLRAQTERVLDRLIAAVSDVGTAAELPDLALSQMVVDCARNLFGRALPTAPVPAAPPSPGGASGNDQDAKVVDDIDTLLQEVSALPVLSDRAAKLAALEVPEELVAVHLHLLLRAEPGKPFKIPPARFTPLFAQPTPPVLAVLRATIEHAATLAGDGAQHRVLSFLREAGLLGTLRACGAVTPEKTVADFPAGFVLFLDCLDPRRSRDAQMLNEVMQRIGVDRVLDAAADMSDDGGLIAHNRDDKVLAEPRGALTPLVHAVLRQGGHRYQARAFDFLQGLHLEEAEALPLRLMSADDVPLEYLRDLSARRANGSYPASLHRQVSLLLVQFLRRAAKRPEELGRCIQVVNELKRFASVESRAMLETIANGRKWCGLLPMCQPTLRRAASLALQATEALHV